MLENFKLLKKYEKILLWVFVVIEIVLFTVSQFKLSITTYIQYSSILLCFVVSLCFAKKNSLNLIISMALFFTICADFILAFTPEHKLLGMLFFCIVQIIYCIYIAKQINEKQQKINLWARIFTIFICEVVLWIIFKDIFNLLSMFVIFYFVNLLFNTTFALVNFKNNPLFAIGLVFFVLCDIFVGFGKMSLFFDVSTNAFFNFVYLIPFNVAWTFYIPSQVLIAVENIIKNAPS